MGLAAASSTLSLGAPKPLAALPASHPWQRSPELHIGIRTGFCGCLTTFSSWSNALLAQAVGGGGRPGGNWPQWLWGWVVGLYVALGSYAAGEHAARLLDDRLRPREERAQGRRDAAAARLAVEAAPSIGVPWSGVVVSDGEDGGNEGLIFSSSLYGDSGDGGEGSSGKAASSSSAARRRGGDGRWGLFRGVGQHGDEEAPAAAAATAAAARHHLDAPARAAAKMLASSGEVTLPLSAVARHHASRAVGTLARRSAVLEQLSAMRRDADIGAAAERRTKHKEGDEEAEAAAAAAEEAVRETARAAAAVARAEAAATDAFAAAAAAAEEEEREEEDLEGGPASAEAPSFATATPADASSGGGSDAGGSRLGRWRQRNQRRRQTPAAAEAAASRAAAAASLSTRRSSAWRVPPPRALSPAPGTTREVSMSLTTLAAKVREGEAATGAAALPSSSSNVSSSSSPHSPPSPTLQRRPLASRATSLLRRGYRSAARAAEGGSDAELNLSAYSFATRTNALAAFFSLTLWLTFLLLFVLDEDKGTTASRRGDWLAVVLAPLGCLVRWRLATLNYSLKGKWRFLPAGTLAANVAGCVVTFAVAAVLERRPASSVWGAAVARALQVGVAGSLSTVSTLSAEVTAQLRRAPADARGYAYLGITWLCAQVVGVVVYGSAVWSAPR